MFAVEALIGLVLAAIVIFVPYFIGSKVFADDKIVGGDKFLAWMCGVFVVSVIVLILMLAQSLGAAVTNF